MSKSILLCGVLAILAAGAIALAFKLPKPVAAQYQGVLAAPADPVDPARLTDQLRKLREEGALP